MIVLGLLVVPYVCFVTVKLASYAFFKGRQLFLDEQEKRKHGDKNTV